MAEIPRTVKGSIASSGIRPVKDVSIDTPSTEPIDIDAEPIARTPARIDMAPHRAAVWVRSRNSLKQGPPDSEDARLASVKRCTVDPAASAEKG